MQKSLVHIIGAGLAGSQAAWHLAQNGVQVHLHEMRPHTKTEAHQGADFAELVCSNSFRSDDAQNNAVGVMHAEMRMLGSLIMQTADVTQVPAGGALAVDRDAFSGAITNAIKSHPNIIIHNEEVKTIPDDWAHVIIATGPLTSGALAEDIAKRTGASSLAFFDAIAPIVYKESINMNVAWAQSRYDKCGPGGTGADYINCPMDREQYDNFVRQVIDGEKTSFKEWEANTPYFSGCQPIEVMAQSGPQTLRFGPMKPVGLYNPYSDKRPYAVVQLRQDNKLGTLFNMVGFQTKLKHAEQVRIFRTIPGLEEAEFARLGGMHRNSYINAPTLLDETLRLKSDPRIRFAGQITGCEGYVESSAIGHLAAYFTHCDLKGETPLIPPPSSAHGALLNHITGGHLQTIDAGQSSYQPMNINFGLFVPLSQVEENGMTVPRKERGRERKRLLAAKALADFAQYAQNIV